MPKIIELKNVVDMVLMVLEFMIVKIFPINCLIPVQNS